MIRHARDAGAKDRRHLPRCLFLVLSLVTAALPLTAAEVRLLRTDPAAARTSTLAAQPGVLRLQLQAGSRSHDLRLRPNTQLGAIVGRTRGQATAYEGRVGDQAGSWAAVTRIGNRWAGVWFDGAEYYGIDTAAALAGSNAEAAAAPADRLLVYRLRDAVWEDVDFHGDSVQVPVDGVQLLEMVGAEAAVPGSQLALLPTRRLTVALLGDSSLARQDGQQAEANLLTQINIVDGIFANQTGVRVQAGSVTLFNSRNDPFSSTTSAQTLLEELKDYRSRTPLQRAAGLTQLMTGRNLNGRTVGIAYLGALCSPVFSASLSQATMAVGFAALVTAHEIGHVFGAPHDAETGSACMSAPTGFLMASQLNGSQTFSACSLEHIAPVVAAASCLAPADAPDAAVEAPTQVMLALDRPTDVTITVHSFGNVPANNTSLRVGLPPWLTLLHTSGPPDSCTLTGNVVRCNLGNLAPATASTVTLRVLATAPATGNASLRVTATDDALRDNDTGNLRFVAEQGADLVSAIEATPATLETGGSTRAIFTLRNRGPAAVDDAWLEIVLPASLTPGQLDTGSLACVAQTGRLTCGPVALDALAEARVVLDLQATAAGNLVLEATGRSSRAEIDPANDRARLTLTVRSPPPVAVVSRGGGGALSLLALAVLAALGAARLQRRLRIQIRAK